MPVKSVCLNIATTGVVHWTADQDYTLDSVIWNGEAAGSYGVLSTDPSLQPVSSSEVRTEFQLNFYGPYQFQILQIGYPIASGTNVYFNVTASGAFVTLLLSWT